MLFRSLMGSRGGIDAPKEFATPSSLVAIGIENPHQLAATFLADADMLRTFIGNSRPVTDDRPLRLSPEQPRGTTADMPEWRRDAERNFLASRFVQHAIPAEIRFSVGDGFASQRLMDQALLSGQTPLP